MKAIATHEWVYCCLFFLNFATELLHVFGFYHLENDVAPKIRISQTSRQATPCNETSLPRVPTKKKLTKKSVLFYDKLRTRTRQRTMSQMGVSNSQ